TEADGGTSETIRGWSRPTTRSSSRSIGGRRNVIEIPVSEPEPACACWIRTVRAGTVPVLSDASEDRSGGCGSPRQKKDLSGMQDARRVVSLEWLPDCAAARCRSAAPGWTRPRRDDSKDVSSWPDEERGGCRLPPQPRLPSGSRHRSAAKESRGRENPESWAQV